MKKFVYLCGMMLLSMNMMAQIDLNDKNWKPIVQDSFNLPGRVWIDETFLSSDGLWRAYPGVGINKPGNLMVYQYNQCHFNDIEYTMELVASYDSSNLIPNHLSELPSWMEPEQGGSGFPNSDSLFFFSGEIDYVKQQESKKDGVFRYGYFEIRCKLPIHTGAFPAFWLWDADSISPSNRYYEEIDIFEYSWAFEALPNQYGNLNAHGAGNPYCFTTGFYYSDTTHMFHWQNSKARNFPMISDSLSHWHTFACEWLPEHIIWYCDGEVVNEYHDSQNIPRHKLTLKTNYAIDKYALSTHSYGDTLIWKASDTMVIDYINVYQLKWDCDTDAIISCQSDLDDFLYRVMKSIVITSANEAVEIGNSEKVTFRVTDSFEIVGPFQIDNGGELTVIMQECPE